jgi:tetratricopeptide (TPR) repeat protein
MKLTAACLHCRLGTTLSFVGWHGAAVHAFRDGMELGLECAEAASRMGDSLGRLARWGEACDAFRLAARLDPASPEPQGNLVLALWRARRPGPALRALDRLIRLRPGQGELHVLLGALLRRQGRHADAIRAFRWAVGLSLSPGWNRFFLGEALLGPVEWPAVVASWQAALGATPAASRACAPGESALNGPPLRSTLRPRGLLGRRRVRAAAVVLALTAGPLTAAPARTEGPLAREHAYRCLSGAGAAGMEDCQKALDLGVGRERAALLLRVLAQKQQILKRWDDAVATYRRLAALTPDDPDAQYRLGAALLYVLNDPESALAVLRAALNLKPDDARAQGDLGAALNALGRFSESTAAFEEALRLDPAFFERRPAAQRLFEASRRGQRWP